MGEKQAIPRSDGDDRGDRHRAIGCEKIGAVSLQRAIHVTRRIPFQQTPAGYQHPPDRAQNRVEAEERFIRKKGKREKRLRDVPPRGARNCNQMLAERHVGRLGCQIG